MQVIVSAATAVSVLRRHASTLVLAEAAEGKLSSSSLSAITAAKKLGGPVAVLAPSSAASDAAKVDGVTKVITVADKAVEHDVAENVTNLVLQLQSANSECEHLVAPADKMVVRVLHQQQVFGAT